MKHIFLYILVCCLFTSCATQSPAPVEYDSGFDSDGGSNGHIKSKGYGNRHDDYNEEVVGDVKTKIRRSHSHNDYEDEEYSDNDVKHVRHVSKDAKKVVETDTPKMRLSESGKKASIDYRDQGGVLGEKKNIANKKQKLVIKKDKSHDHEMHDDSLADDDAEEVLVKKSSRVNAVVHTRKEKHETTDVATTKHKVSAKVHQKVEVALKKELDVSHDIKKEKHTKLAVDDLDKELEDLDVDVKKIDVVDVKKSVAATKEVTKVVDKPVGKIEVENKQGDAKKDDKVLVEDDAANKVIAEPKETRIILLKPVNDGKIITKFGQQVDGSKNNGIDFAVPQGTGVSSVDDGIVVHLGRDSKFGNSIIVKHDNGDLYTAYAHLQSISVQKGQRVKKGDIIAKVGATGSTNGSKLYFAIRKGKDPVNPEDYF